MGVYSIGRSSQISHNDRKNRAQKYARQRPAKIRAPKLRPERQKESAQPRVLQFGATLDQN